MASQEAAEASVPQHALSKEENTVYDRQLRVWGHEVQSRLSAARVLIIGGDSLAAEVAKNLVLAGVGHVGLVDDTPCSQVDFGNFLVTADADPSSSVSHACIRTLSAMNPLISCSSVSLGQQQQPTPSTAQSSAAPPGVPHQASGNLHIDAALLASWDLVLSTCGLSRAAVDSLESACASAEKQLYVCEVVGPLAYAYVHLGHHTYTEKAGQGQQAADAAPAVREVAYPRLLEALSRPVSQCMGRRPVHPLYQVLRVAWQFEEVHGRAPRGELDVGPCHALAEEIEAREGAPVGSISRPMLETLVCSARGPHTEPSLAAAPVAAVAGGLLANSVIRTVSKVGAPLNNWLFFTLNDGQGVVEAIHGPLPK